MEETVNKVSSNLRKLFKRAHDGLVADKGCKILVSHHGTFSQELVGSLSNGVEELLISKGDKKKVIKRMFSILLEGLQNIRLHGERDEKDAQLAYLIIGSTDEKYTILLANMVKSSESAKIKAYMEELNSYSIDSIKSKYMEVLSNEFMSSKGGAGLGLITTRMKSNKMVAEFHPLSEEHDLFVLEVTLNRI